MLLLFETCSQCIISKDVFCQTDNYIVLLLLFYFSLLAT